MSDETENDELTFGVCGNCHFSVAVPLNDESGRPVVGKSQLVCRRFPPTVTIVPVIAQGPNGQQQMVPTMQSIQPVVDEKMHGCFEHVETDENKTLVTGFDFGSTANEE